MGSIRIAVPALAVAMLATIALCPGCGASPKPLTRAQLVEKADSICHRVAAKLETVNKGKSISTQQQIIHVVRELAGVEQSALHELSQLVPPARLQAEWNAFLSSAQSLGEDTAAFSESASSKDAAAAKRTLASAEATQRQMAAIAKRNGFKDCEGGP